MHIRLVLPVSSAVCERAQKGIKSDVRGSLHIDTLIRISMTGPSLEEFDAKEAVHSQCKRSRKPNYKGWPSEPPTGGCALRESKERHRLF